MTKIFLKVNGTHAVASADGKLTSGMVGLPVTIDYDNSWDGLTKTAFFRVGNSVRKRDSVGTYTEVPWEILRTHGNVLEIGIEGKNENGSVVIPTTWAVVSKIQQGAHGDIPAAPKLGVDQPSGGAGANIDDSQTSISTTWSSEKIDKEIKNGKSEIIKDNLISYNSCWSSKHTVDKLCPAFEESGSVVQCEPVEGYPLDVVTQIEPVQSGSGDPSPDNIRPITGHTSVTLTHLGKNLASTDILVGASGITETDGVFSGMVRSFSESTRNIGFVPAKVFEEGQQYVFSLYAKKGTAESSPYTVVKYTDGTQSGENITATGDFERYISVSSPGKTVQGVWLSYGSGGTDTLYIKDVQVEKGKTATAYESPREENTITLDLGQTVYGGSLDWKTGVLTVDRATIIIDGTESWTQNSVYNGNEGLRYDCDIATTLLFKDVEFISSHYPYVSPNQGRGMWMYPKSDRVGLRIIWTYETADELKAYLAEQYAAGTPVQICCPLATPITVQLTPQEVMALSGTNCLISDTGNITVTGRADPLHIIDNLGKRLAALEAAVVNNT